MNDKKIKSKNAIIIILLVTMMISSFAVSGVAAKRPSSPPPSPPPIEFDNQNGLNYAGAYWHFDSAITTDEVLNRDFALFQSGKIDLICLNIHLNSGMKICLHSKYVSDNVEHLFQGCLGL